MVFRKLTGMPLMTIASGCSLISVVLFAMQIVKAAPPVNVDCDAGDTIQSVLDGAVPRGKLTIKVKGICGVTGVQR